MQSLTLCLLCRHDRGLAQGLHASCWPCLSSHRKAPSAGGTCSCFCSALHLTRFLCASFLCAPFATSIVCVCVQGGGKNAIRIFSHFPHFFSHFLGRSLSVMFKRIHSSGIV